MSSANGTIYLPVSWMMADRLASRLAYQVFHALDDDVDGVEQSQFSIGEFHLLNQGHDGTQRVWRIRQECRRIELHLIGHMLKLLPSGHANDLVVEGFVLVE